MRALSAPRARSRTLRCARFPARLRLRLDRPGRRFSVPARDRALDDVGTAIRGCRALCQNRRDGTHLVRADVRPVARQGCGRRGGSVPVGGRADGSRDHRRHRHVQPPRRSAAAAGRRASRSRDGRTLLPSSLDDAFVLDGPGEYEVKEVLVTGVRTYRDDARGAEAGKQVSFVVEVDGVHTIHLGDIGHLLSEEKLGDIGSVDIACVPLGGSLSPTNAAALDRPARSADRRADADLRRRRRLRRGAQALLPRDGRRGR